MELFSQTPQHSTQPLAYRMCPRTLTEYIGQEHIIGDGRLLRRAIQADQLSSIIFYGPPGTGKTTLARVIANTTSSRFVTMNAVLSGVKDLRVEIQEARDRLALHGKRTILFIDEVHRWNKSQQDALLPWVENGTVILIGATTENPYFEVNAALVSRSRIFQLKQLTRDDLLQIARQAIADPERGYGSFTIDFEQGALEHIIDIANGDARSLLNALQLAVETTGVAFPPPNGSTIAISRAAAEESIQKKVVLYDKEGDYHFDVISAFIKSIRGSDPDAALYWLARMVRAGEDPKYIFRRMLIAASEDIGLAAPEALGVVEAAAAAFDRVGLPEGRFHLAQAALYLATAEKSNSTLGFFDALKSIERDEDSEVPVHLKDASRDSKSFGHGAGYLYPHAYRDHWVAQQYLPTGIQGSVFYQPSDSGYEATIRQRVLRNREAQIGAAEAGNSEVLTFSPADNSRDAWLKRLVSGAGERLSVTRDAIFAAARFNRHDRILVLRADDGVLLWESCRKAPEGGVFAVVTDAAHLDTLAAYGAGMREVERPVIVHAEPLSEFARHEDLAHLRFDKILGINTLTRLEESHSLLSALHTAAAVNGMLILSEIIPRASTRLSSLIPPSHSSLQQLLLDGEQAIYTGSDNPLINWDADQLTAALEEHGFSILSAASETAEERRLITPADIDRWMQRLYLPAITAIRGDDPDLSALTAEIARILCNSPVSWQTTSLLICAEAVT